MAEEEVPYGMTQINYVTQYGVRVTHGVVLLGLRTSNPTYEPPLGYLYGLEAEQAMELAKEIHEAATQLMSE